MEAENEMRGVHHLGHLNGKTKYVSGVVVWCVLTMPCVKLLFRLGENRLTSDTAPGLVDNCRVERVITRSNRARPWKKRARWRRSCPHCPPLMKSKVS